MKYQFWIRLAVKFTALPVLLLLSAMPLTAADTGGHRGAITAVIHTGNRIISGGEDGFIRIWNMRTDAAGERFQLTRYGIEAMVKHPNRDEICIIESGGIDQYRISVWNYKDRKKLFTLRSRYPVTFVNYSAGGSFIIAGGLDGHNLAILDSTSGMSVSFPNVLTGTASFAVTGRAERNMLVYQPNAGYGGMISYLDLDSAVETNRFEAPDSLSSPIVFGNNRFLAGINREGLLIVDAASGTILDRMGSIGRSARLCAADNEFLCVNREEGSSVMYRFAVDNRGKLVTRQRRALSFSTDGPISSVAANESAVFGTIEGNLFVLGQQGRTVQMPHTARIRITEIAATRSRIAFLTENSELCFIPLNYRHLQRMQKLELTDKSGYTRICALGGTDEGHFLLWQTANTRFAPALINANQQTNEDDLIPLTSRFPLRSVSSRNNKVLFLDATGNVSVYDQNDFGKRAIFTFSSVGATDAALVNHENFILCRSVVSGNSSFLIVNINTGETLPLFHPSRAGIMVYTGDSGNVYGAAVEQDSPELYSAEATSARTNSGGIKTAVIGLPASSTGQARRIFEYPGEDPLSAAESAGALAVAAGEGAAIYARETALHNARETALFERTEGLPVKLLGCNEFFLSLDSEGNIAWHDNKSGKLLALFRLHADKWALSGDREISGSLSRP